MKPLPSSTAARADVAQAPRTSRRRLVVGAGIAAGTAVAVAALQRKAEPTQVAAAENVNTPAQGYRLTDHVRRYYETTRT